MGVIMADTPDVDKGVFLYLKQWYIEQTTAAQGPAYDGTPPLSAQNSYRPAP